MIKRLFPWLMMLLSPMAFSGLIEVTGGPLQTSEDKTSDSFIISLDLQQAPDPTFTQVTIDADVSDSSEFLFDLGGFTQGTTSIVLNAANNWMQEIFVIGVDDFDFDGDIQGTIDFLSPVFDGYCDVDVDGSNIPCEVELASLQVTNLDNEVAQVPEPSSLLLMLIGVAGLWQSRRTA